jgi:WD40 repeat protein
MIIEDLISRTDLPMLTPANISDWATIASESVEQSGGFAWSPLGAAWSSYRDVILVHQGRRCILQGHTGYIAGLAFSTDGHGLASASHDTTVRLWDVRTCSHRSELASDPYMILAVAFSPDATRLASCGGERLPVRLWDVATGEETARFNAPGADSFQSVAFTPSGNQLVACDLTGQVVLWDLDSGDLHAVGHHDDMAMAVAVSLDGSLMASASQDGRVKLWQIPGLSLQNTFETGEALFSVAFHPNNELVIAGDMVGRLHVWNLSTLERHRIIQAHTDLVSSASFNRLGTLLASVSIDGSITLWGGTGTLQVES